MKKARTSRSKLVAASVAGFLAVAGSSLFLSGTASAEDVACYGINKCKATGDCGGKGHTCHAQNACKGQGYLTLDKDTCLKIEGGRLEAEQAAS